MSGLSSTNRSSDIHQSFAGFHTFNFNNFTIDSPRNIPSNSYEQEKPITEAEQEDIMDWMRPCTIVYTPRAGMEIQNDPITDKAKKKNLTCHFLDKWIFEFCQYYAALWQEKADVGVHSAMT